MDREQIEALAGEIVARLEGRTAPVQAPAQDGAEVSKEQRGLLSQWEIDGLRRGEEAQRPPETAAGPEPVQGQSAPFLSLRRDMENQGRTESGQGPASAQRSAPVTERADMQRISDSFMRDSRRYDSGFERY